MSGQNVLMIIMRRDVQIVKINILIYKLTDRFLRSIPAWRLMINGIYIQFGSLFTGTVALIIFQVLRKIHDTVIC